MLFTVMEAPLDSSRGHHPHAGIKLESALFIQPSKVGGVDIADRIDSCYVNHLYSTKRKKEKSGKE